MTTNRPRPVMIHCPEGRPGPPYEVIGQDDALLGRFDSLEEATRVAEAEAARLGTTATFSPLARRYM